MCFVLLRYRDISITQMEKCSLFFLPRSVCRCRQTLRAMAWLSVWKPVRGCATLPLAGIPPTCGGRSMSLHPNKLPFCKTAHLPENHTSGCGWNTKSVILSWGFAAFMLHSCCAFVADDISSASLRPAYNILKAMQKLINSKYVLNLITQLVHAFTFAHAGIKPSSFSSS